FFVSIHSEPGTTTRLQTLLFDSLIAELRGSIVATPSTPKLYRYAPGSRGPSVTSHTPFSPFVIAAPGPLPGISLPFSRTASARGAKMRNVTWRSASTSGDTTGGGPSRPGAWLNTGGDRVNTAAAIRVRDQSGVRFIALSP